MPDPFASCLAYVLGIAPEELPAIAGGSPTAWRAWLAGRGLGLVPVARPETFLWAGHWIARLVASGGAAAGSPGRWAVVFGVPPGPVYEPEGPVDGEILEGYVVAALEPVAARLPAADRPGPGIVESIWIAPAAEAAMTAVDAVEAGLDGLAGDRYAAGAGTFSAPGASGSALRASGTALTLVEAEALEAVALPDGARLPAAQARRNIVTRGIALNDLVGRRFRVGEAECAGARLCEPCAHLQRLTRPGVLRSFVHRAGLRADIVVPGLIRVGDPVVAGR